MKLQAHVIMNMALGLSLGLGAAGCQKTGKSSEDLAESETSPDTPVQPDWAHILQGDQMPVSIEQPETIPEPVVKHKVMPVSKTEAHHDPCPACGMG